MACGIHSFPTGSPSLKTSIRSAWKRVTCRPWFLLITGNWCAKAKPPNSSPSRLPRKTAPGRSFPYLSRPLLATLETRCKRKPRLSPQLPFSKISNAAPIALSVGNDTPYYASDRYIATMFPDTNQPPIVVSGHTFSLFQIDLSEFGLYQPATMLNDDSLPRTPPDLALVQAGDRLGRFLCADASFQNRMTSLTNVPEPSPVVLVVAGLVAPAFSQRAERLNSSGKRVKQTTTGDQP